MASLKFFYFIANFSSVNDSTIFGAFVTINLLLNSDKVLLIFFNNFKAEGFFLSNPSFDLYMNLQVISHYRFE